MPNKIAETKANISYLLNELTKKMFGSHNLNFLSLNNIPGLRVVNGDNCLDTCFQYAVKDNENRKLLNIKVYDKFLDLCGRDGYQRIGSRFNRVLGSKLENNSFIKRTKECQWTGMTRLEVSICKDALENYSPFQKSLMTVWYKRITTFIELIHENILNCPYNTENTYRNLIMPELLGRLSNCRFNVLLIGLENTWIVNAKTSHKLHFVGTKLACGLTKKAQRVQSWLKLAQFALRYAAPGSLIKVFKLHTEDGEPIQVSNVLKNSTAPF